MNQPELPQRLENCTLSEAIGLLADEEFSGSMVWVTELTRREICFSRGTVYAARSNLETEMLGQWLVDKEFITEEQRAMMLLSQNGSDTRTLGELLVAKGIIEGERLTEELEELALLIVTNAGKVKASDIELLQPEAGPPHATFPSLTTAHLRLVAARAYEDEQEKAAVIGSLDQSVWPSPIMGSLLQELRLTPVEGFLLSRLDKIRRIDELIKISSLTQQQVIDNLYALYAVGTLQIGIPPHPEVAPCQDSPRIRAAEITVTVDESGLEEEEVAERHHIKELAAHVHRVDHYRALDLDIGADSREIQRAWLTIDRQFNPSRASQLHLGDMREHLAAVHERASEAFAVLSKQESRARYDKILEEIRCSTAEGNGAQNKSVSREAQLELVEANIKRANELLRDGEPFLAIRMLEQACALDPRPAELVKLARLQQRNPLWTNRALLSLKRAIDIDPHYVDAWLDLAEFWRSRGNTERQRTALERALTVAPEDKRLRRMYLGLASSEPGESPPKKRRKRDK